MANPILVTGAAGRVGAVGRTVTELLLKQGEAGRAMVRDDVLRHVCFGCLPGRDGQCGGGGEASRSEGVHQYVADDGLSDEHYRNYSEPAAQAALARRAGAQLVRSAGCARAADSVSRRVLPDFDSGFSQGI